MSEAHRSLGHSDSDFDFFFLRGQGHGKGLAQDFY
jgi:hypothetical protein